MMQSDVYADSGRLGVLTQVQDRLLAALSLSDAVEESLLSAQIALALDTVQGALTPNGGALDQPREVGASAR